MDLVKLFPPQAWQLLLVLGLSFLLGLEREGRKATAGHYIFGGVRTFPLIGFLGYALALLSSSQVLPMTLGLLAVAAFMAISYWHKVTQVGDAGVTTEVTGLLTFVLGGLVAAGWYWLATAVVVVSMLLLELKTGLENLAERIPSEEVSTLTKFLLLTAVILPLLPNQTFTSLAINPLRLWLIVVAVSGLSYLSYLVQLLLGERSSLAVSALLGGLYSSTVTTVVLARRSREQGDGSTFAAAMALASSVMYLRVLVLLGLFQPRLGAQLAAPLMSLCTVGVFGAASWLAWSLRREAPLKAAKASVNPLEISTALVFAAVFLLLRVGIHWAAETWGDLGTYLFSLVAGSVDVDPYIMGVAQQTETTMTIAVGSRAVLLALSGNQLAKGFYALVLGARKAGRWAFVALFALALAGLAPIMWLD